MLCEIIQIKQALNDVHNMSVFVFLVINRCVSDSAPTTTSAQVGSLKTLETDQGPSKIRSPQSSPKPHPRSSVRPPVPSLSQDEVGPAGSASPILFRRMKSGAATMIQPSHHHPNPPLTPTHGRDSPSAAKVLH